MSQIVGHLSSTDKYRVGSTLRPTLLTTPVPLKPDNLTLPGALNNQTVQLVDDLNNAAAYTRNVPFRTTLKVISQDLASGDPTRIRLPYCTGNIILMFTRADSITPPSGYISILDSRMGRDGVAPVLFNLMPGSSITFPANTHFIDVKGTGCNAGDLATVVYNMESYLTGVVFSALPSIGDTLTFSQYARFEFCEEGDPSTVATGNIPVEIPASTDIDELCENLVTAFNDEYIAKVEPAGYHSDFSWASMILEEDQVMYYNTDDEEWKIADENGVMFISADSGMVRNIMTSNIDDIYIVKYL